MSAMSYLLSTDTSVYCVSAYNDNGQPEFVFDPSRVRADLIIVALVWRTDYFPALGWMIYKSQWNELKQSWPTDYWRDWIHSPLIRQERVCVYPEVSRIVTFGDVGINKHP